MSGPGGRWSADLRLSAPALCAWAAAGLLTGVSGWNAAAAAGCGAASGGAFIGAKLAARSAARTALVTVGICLAGIALVGVSIMAQKAVWSPSSFDSLAAHDRSVNAVLTITRPATRIHTPDRFSGQDRYAVHARMTHAVGGGVAIDLDAPITVFADQTWGDLPPGTTATGRLTLSEPDPGRRTAADARPHGAPTIVAGAHGAARLTTELRKGLQDASSGLAPDSAGLLPGLVDGDTSRVPESLTAAMKDTGLTHLVAVSGSNLAIIAGAVLVVGAVLCVGRWVQLGGAAAGLVGYVVLVGPDPSVLRSAVMAWLALLGLLSGRSGRGLPALSLAVVVLVVADPWFGRDFGFALSVLACAGLLVCVRPWAAALGRVMPRWLALAIAVPAAAQAFCAPVIILLRPRLSVFAVPANLLAGPVVPGSTIFGVVAIPVAVVWLPAARFLAWWAGLGTWWIGWVARFFAGLPAATVPWPEGVGGAVLLVVVTVAGCLVAVVALRSRRSLVVTAAVMVAVVGLLWRPVTSLPDRWLPAAAGVVVCDVGQGSGAVVRTGVHAGMVFDVGEEPADIDGCLSAMGITTVSLVVLSHFDLDHVGGLTGVLVGRSVKRVLVSPLRQPAANAARVYGELSAAGLEPDVGVAGMSGVVGGVRWRLVWPVAGGSGVVGSGTASNESALVAFVMVGGVRVVFPADLDAATQSALRRGLVRGEGSVPRVDVLVVSHHGSKDQDPGFNRALGPRVAVVSVGAGNDYGHPAPETLSLLAGMGVRVFRTDECGSVAFTVGSGSGLGVSSEHACGKASAR